MRSACYPRRTFYPMSDGPSMRNHRITKTNFVPARHVCLTVKLPYAFALNGWFPISLRNLCKPPLLFGRRPPQSNYYPPDTVSKPDNGFGLEFKTIKGGISRMAPHTLACMLQSLPPILHMIVLNPMSSYSKGAQGLSVLPRVTSIFTGNSISLSLC